MILFLKHPRARFRVPKASNSWNFSWDRRREQSKTEQRAQRKQKEAISKVQSEGFLKMRSML
jgi:hypothetical protein